MNDAGGELKILICGTPKGGKTTLAHQLAVELEITNLFHTDDLAATMEWSEASEAASHWFDEPAPWIVEGVAVPRALRKWLKRNPGKPLDAQIIVLTKPYLPLLKGQIAMAKGAQTVMREITPDLKRAGVVFVNKEQPAEAR